MKTRQTKNWQKSVLKLFNTILNVFDYVLYNLCKIIPPSNSKQCMVHHMHNLRERMFAPPPTLWHWIWTVFRGCSEHLKAIPHLLKVIQHYHIGDFYIPDNINRSVTPPNSSIATMKPCHRRHGPAQNFIWYGSE